MSASKQSRREFLRSVAAAAVLAGADRALARGSGRKPNIVLIMADDLGYECLGCYGSTYRTPNLDRLAETGMRFTHCYAQPLCTPSRVKIMTGRYNHRNYIRFGVLDLKQTTFAHVLKKAGYSTCISGKWQLTSGADKGPNMAGFDEYCLWHMEDFDKPKGSRYANPKLIENGKLRSDTQGRYGPDVCTDYICDFIERKKDGPFLVYYPMILTHAPNEPTPDSDGWNPAGKAKANVKYFADMVAYMDKVIGRIIAKLDEVGLRENTLILFTGDNGTTRGIKTPMKDDSVIVGGKGSMTDAGTHVALIGNWKGAIGPAGVCDDLVDFSDFMPTLAQAAGVAPPSDIDGHSFLPQLLGRKSTPRKWIHIWYRRDPGNPVRQFTRDKRYKLYADGKLYDIEKDVLEKKPITNPSPEAAAARKRLQQALDSVNAK